MGRDGGRKGFPAVFPGGDATGRLSATKKGPPRNAGAALGLPGAAGYRLAPPLKETEMIS